jgi:hypothetical protein
VVGDNTLSIHRFVKYAAEGKLQLNEKTVLIIDELSTVGTRQMLEIARLREKHGFQVVGLGDPLQTKSVEAGPVIDLMRKAVGPENVPEILSSVRQLSERDRETTLMFREGRAGDALARKREDGTVLVIPGDREHAIKAAADLWQERRSVAEEMHAKLGASSDTFTIAVSTPRNFDAREIASEIRARKQALGEVGQTKYVVPAVDQRGEKYSLPLAAGDNVRLFERVHGSINGGRASIIGSNGSIVKILDLDDKGMHVRTHKGTEAFVKWERVRDRDTGRIKLTYGDVISLDARTGDTAIEHITVLASGSHQINARSGYMGMGRDRTHSWLIVSDGEERKEILGRRPLGDARPVTIDTVINNVARNMAHQPRRCLRRSFWRPLSSCRGAG